MVIMTNEKSLAFAVGIMHLLTKIWGLNPASAMRITNNILALVYKETKK